MAEQAAFRLAARGRPVARQKFRVPSAHTSRRRHDSPEIRHLRYYVRRRRIAALGRGVGTGPDVKREHDWVGRPPRGWRRRLRRSTWRRWWRRVERRQQRRQQQQRIEWGCRRHELRLVVTLLDVQFSAGDVVGVFPSPAVERSGNAVARRREQHWVGYTAGWILHAQRWRLLDAQRWHIVRPHSFVGLKRFQPHAPRRTGLQPAARRPAGDR